LVADHEDQVAYGAIGINSIHPLHQKAEVGFWLLPEYWGKGFIPEAGKLVVEYAFEKLKLHRLEALVETENEASKKVLQKLKFSYEGTMHECEWKDERWVSLEMYGRLKNP
jgi:ribosomal-protein-alanine N-acetyltransferase